MNESFAQMSHFLEWVILTKIKKSKLERASVEQINKKYLLLVSRVNLYLQSEGWCIVKRSRQTYSVYIRVSFKKAW